MVFKVNPQAKSDIQDQIHFYNDKQKGLGKHFHNDVKSTFKSIRKNPFLQIRYRDVRCLPLKKFPAVGFISDKKISKRFINSTSKIFLRNLPRR